MDGEGVVTDEERVRALVGLARGAGRRARQRAAARGGEPGRGRRARRRRCRGGGSARTSAARSCSSSASCPSSPPTRSCGPGFTAAVSHELRTPLARLLVLLETATLPGADVDELVEQARQEIEATRDLIDDVLFLGELETGREVVSLGRTRALPVLEEVAAAYADRALHAEVALQVSGGAEIELPLRPRMLRVSSRTSSRTRSATRGPGARAASASRTRATRRGSPCPTTARAPRRRTSSACSSASTARTPRARRAAPGSGSRSSSTSSPRRAARSRRAARPGRGLEIVCRFPA